MILVAPSGWGKTTFFRALSGWYDYAGSPVRVSRECNFNPFSDVEFIGNHQSLLPWMRVRDNIRLRTDVQDLKIIIEILEAVGLPRTAADLWPYQLSLGMYKRVEFAISILCGRELLLLDEFFSSLDEMARASCMQLLKDRRNGLATIVSSHNPETLIAGDTKLIELSRSLSTTNTLDILRVV